MKYANLKKDAKILWAMAKIMLSGKLSLSEIVRVTETVTVGVFELVRYLDETSPAEKKDLALQLVDDFYREEIEPRDLLPWPAAEEAQDKLTGMLVHKAASVALDRMLNIK